ncbi:MAG: RsmD family RNA methyltransferase [Bacteroidales bacterium]|jgi:16S rRNA (guanine(966)-N(2))-methyltransferase RsmD|nr:RsmD family RNA methyltransferase [Bacteroidales bacterium]
MRIVSGKYKGRRFDPGKKFVARPTTDFAKENLFNVLSNIIDFSDIEVLDLFGGTGSISYEFASRGAKSIDCVEMNHNHYSFIKSVINDLKIDTINTYKADVFKFLSRCRKKYDVIFADPPFDMENIPEVAKMVFENDMLSPEGVLIMEHSAKTDFSEYSSFLHETRVYGRVCFSIFFKKD